MWPDQEERWYESISDGSWDDAKRRALLAEAPQLYARRGTRWALARVLEIYTGQKPAILDDAADQPAFTFEVVLLMDERTARRDRIEAIINAHKPAYTAYTLRFERPA